MLVARGREVRELEDWPGFGLAVRVLRRRRWPVGAAIESISMSSGRRPAALAEEELAPSDDQSTLKLVVADDAEEGLERSILVELGASTLLTDNVVG